MKNHTIVVIPGDGIGPEVVGAMQQVVGATGLDINWIEALMGEAAGKDNLLPQKTLDLIRTHKVAIKGPTGTPTGGKTRSVNVALRKALDLYACVRPIQYTFGCPSPLKNPLNINIVIFRENLDDVYAGIEFEAGSEAAKELLEFLKTKHRGDLDPEEFIGIGIKPMSRRNTQRVTERAVAYACAHGFKRITFMHKGNIMKFTEGAFLQWGTKIAHEMLRHRSITREELEILNWKLPRGKILVDDLIADNCLQQLILRPQEFGVIIAPNLNGDYVSEVIAALVGGVGLAAGANIGDRYAVFEATHGTWPAAAGKGWANPTPMILSSCLMLEYLGEPEAAQRIKNATLAVIAEGKNVTRDINSIAPVTTTQMTEAIIEKMQTL